MILFFLLILNKNYMFKSIILVVLCFVTVCFVYTQNGNDSKTVLEKLSESERDLIGNPIEGRMILNTTTNCINYYSNNQWYSLCGKCLPETPEVLIDSVNFTNGQLAIYFNDKIKAEMFNIKVEPLNWHFTTTHSPLIVNVRLDSVYTSINLSAEGVCGEGPIIEKDSVLLYTYSSCGQQKEITDKRDGSKYQLAEMFGQCWIKGYLRYFPEGSKDIITKNEHLFYKGNVIEKMPNGLCPAGFHIPFKNEVGDLLESSKIAFNQYSLEESYNYQIKELGVEFVGGYDSKKNSSFEGISDFFWINTGKGNNDPNLVLLNSKGMLTTIIPSNSFMPIRCIKD